jgi:hypothetical protein
MILVFSIMLLLALYTYFIVRLSKSEYLRLNLNASKIIKNIHYSTLLISLVIGFIYTQFDTGLRGLWTTRTIVITTLITGLFFILIANKSSTNKIEKFYFKSFSFLPTIAGAILCVPLIGAVTIIPFFIILFSPASKVFYDDSHLRIQSTFTGLFAPSYIEVYSKRSLFEKKIEIEKLHEIDISSVEVNYDIDSTRILFFESYGERTEPKKIVIKKVK